MKKYMEPDVCDDARKNKTKHVFIAIKKIRTIKCQKKDKKNVRRGFVCRSS